MTLGQNGTLRYGHFGEFLEFFWDIMANLGLIDFKLGVYIKFLGSNFFGGLNQKSAMISMCNIHIYIDSESFRQIH